MKILWVGDAGVSTGFARCTHAVCDHLYAQGWDVDVLGVNYYGDPYDYPYNIWPCSQPWDGGRDNFGLTRLPRMIQRLRPDVVVLLTDPWHVVNYMRAIDSMPDEVPRPHVVGWLAVDARNQDGEPLNQLDHVVTWTDFADMELRRGGYQGDSSVVPLGVDLSVFRPIPKDAALKEALGGFELPEGSHLIGLVGRNQPRKRLDLALSYFADWIKQYERDDVYLYAHVAPTGEKGFHLEKLTKYFGLHGRVLWTNAGLGQGYTNEQMAHIYNALDCYWTTTSGEGWGLPCLEAMACGVPVVVPDFSGLGSWVPDDVGIKVQCSEPMINAPLNSKPYTVGMVPERQASIEALEQVIANPKDASKRAARGLELAQSLTWERTAWQFESVLSQVLSVERAA